MIGAGIIEGIAPEVWNYHIGGYQVLNKYLQDAKGRTAPFNRLTRENC